jgi:hypothetical protein
VPGGGGTIVNEFFESREALEILEHLYARHNHDDRPDGQICPSMSIGDVIVIAETAYTVADFGFVQVDFSKAVILELTWKQAFDQLYRSAS